MLNRWNNNIKKLPILKILLRDIDGNISEEKKFDLFRWKLYNSIIVQIMLFMYNHSYLKLNKPYVLEYFIVR